MDRNSNKPPLHVPVYLRIWFFILLFLVGFFGVAITPWSLLLWPIDIVLMIQRVRWSIQNKKGKPVRTVPETVPETAQKRYFVFDVETPNTRNNRICELGAALIEHGKIVWSKEYLINPDTYFSPQNTEIHGITEDDVKDAPIFPKVWAEIQPMLEGCTLVAHNAPFDLSVLSKTAGSYKIDLAPMEYLCTLKLTRNYLPELDHHRLNDVCDYYGIPLDHHHAGSDSVACAEILLRLMAAGYPVERMTCLYTFDLKDKPYTRLNNESKMLNELLRLLEGVAEDGVLTEAEALTVSRWIDEHNELEGNYPYDQVFSALQSALEDGVLEHEELDTLLKLFQQLTNPLSQMDCLEGGIDLDGKLVCLTGEFYHDSLSNIVAELERQGAVIKNNVVKQLDYLVVGARGSADWSAGNYGNKVKKALELQAEGAKVQIVSEDALLSALKECPGAKQI